MEKFFVFLAFFFAVQSGFSQDKLYKSNGDSLAVKVKQIGPATTIYKRFDNPDGPDYVVTNKSIIRIVFENGAVENFNKAEVKPQPTSPVVPSSPQKITKNTFFLVPFNVLQTVPYGFGVAYERRIGKAQVFALYLPASFLMVMEGNDAASSSSGKAKRTGSMGWFYPGIKVYLVSNKKKTTSLAILTNWGLGFGSIPVARSYSYTDPDGYYHSGYEYGWQDKFSLGMMVGGSLNFEPKPRFVLGMDLGFGFSFTDSSNDNTDGFYNSSRNSYTSAYSNSSYMTGTLLRFAVLMGYKF